MCGVPARHALLGVLLPLALALTAAPARAQAGAFVAGEVVVRFKPAADGAERAAARAVADVTAVRSLELDRAQLVEVDTGQTVRAAVRELEANRDVAFAEPNWVYRTTATLPDDPGFGQLWGLDNTGQSVLGASGVADSDIDAPEAWDITTGAGTVTVAVVDTGVAYDHPDLAANVVPGWDFVDNDSDPRDLNGHGTHVAGTVAAVGNNGLGTTGVSWSARIMPLRVLDAAGRGTNAAIADAFAYAAENGARVVNASLGGPTASAAIDAAISAHPSTLYVTAAGNDAQNNDTTTDYPCNAPFANVVCVAATDQSDGLASFSNYGAETVDLGAPGRNVRSTTAARVDLPATAATDSFEAGLAKWVQGGAGGQFADTSSPTVTAAFPGATSGTYVLDDTPTAALYKSGESYWITTAGKVDLTGRVGCRLRFDRRLDLDQDRDFLDVLTSPDGATWTLRDEFTGWTGGGWRTTGVALGSDGAQVFVRFRVRADATQGPDSYYDGVQIDDVAVDCIDTAYDASDYGNLSGTSMASPHVAGAAAVLAAYRPDATLAQLRSWLLDTGDPLPALAGRTATGRRLNLLSAVLASQTAPGVVTAAATRVEQTGAVLEGSVDANGFETAYAFEWGTSTAYGNATPAVPVSVGSGGAPVSVSQALTDLRPGTTYHYRVVAYRAGSVSAVGPDVAFTTLPAASTAAAREPATDAPAPPTAGVVAPGPAAPPVPGGGSETAPAPKPAVAVRVPAQTRRGAAVVAVSCVTACTATARLVAPPRLVRRLGLVAWTVGARSFALAAGRTELRAPIHPAVRRKLRRLGIARAPFRLVLSVVDGAGATTTFVRRPRIPVG